MKIAFAWELGANYGHLERIRPLAEHLRDRGHEVLIVLRDARTADELLTPRGLPFVISPFPERASPLGRPPVNYSHILADYGYLDRMLLRTLVRAWVNLWHMAKPDVIVIDHAPTALLSARILSIPTLLFGAPFSIPPQLDPLPAIRPWQPASMAELGQADRLVLTTINDVLAAHGHRSFERVADLFAGSLGAITTFAELDTYRSRPTPVEYLGPITGRETYQTHHWKADSDQRRVFAYLRTGVPGLEPLLEAMRRAPIDPICVIPDAPESMVRRLRHEGLEIRNATVDLNIALLEADLGINYGGAGITAQSLLKGLPLLFAPHALEQHLNARQAASVGAAIVVETHKTRERFGEAIEQLLQQQEYRASAQRFAEKYSAFDTRKAIEKLGEMCNRAANGVLT